MLKITPDAWKAELPLFREKLEGFQAGTVKKPDYKGFSGRFGSYAQRDPMLNMLRLRMPAGRISGEKLTFLSDAVRKYGVTRAHFTTCQTVQLHDLDIDATCGIMEEAMEAGIITMGAGGDYPRNTMCSPLSGVEQGEYFDVLPYAEAAGSFAMRFIDAPKMPRKLKIGFSNSPANLPHATYRDLGFVARPDGAFDVYSAGGLGNNPKFGVKVAEAVNPSEILVYVQAMYLTFCAYGNYENRGKARTRYMQDICGGPDSYREAFLGKLEEARQSGMDFSFTVDAAPVTKIGDGSTASGSRIIPQKQDGLYSVVWHPIGGNPDIALLCKVCDTAAQIPSAEMRISPDESIYIVNLTGAEAVSIADLTADNSAESLFETSVSCIGASICQVGLRDSQALLAASVKAVREAGIPDGALPQIHISGCPSSCGTHQTGELGFRGAAKNRQNAFMLYYGGCSEEGKEVMGRELGAILESEIPAFLVELGQTVAESGMNYSAWNAANPGRLEEIAAPYLA